MKWEHYKYLLVLVRVQQAAEGSCLEQRPAHSKHLAILAGVVSTMGGWPPVFCPLPGHPNPDSNLYLLCQTPQHSPGVSRQHSLLGDVGQSLSWEIRTPTSDLISALTLSS